MAGSRRIRTDLALETTERFAQENTEIRGVEIQEDYDEEKDIRTTVVKIVTENGAKSMGRPQGNYITIEAPDLSNADEDYHREISQEISRHLRELIDLEKERSILVVGLGNAAITADALGPHVIENLHMTRHLIREYGIRGIGQEKIHCVSGIVPGVMAQTGDGDSGDRAGRCLRDKARCGGCNRCTCSAERAEVEPDDPDHRYGNSPGIRSRKSQEWSHGRKSSGESDRDRRADSCGCGDDRA